MAEHLLLFPARAPDSKTPEFVLDIIGDYIQCYSPGWSRSGPSSFISKSRASLGSSSFFLIRRLASDLTRFLSDEFCRFRGKVNTHSGLTGPPVPVPWDRDRSVATKVEGSDLLLGKEFAMADARVVMHSVQEILRLHRECGCSQRQIARSCGLSVGAVNRVLRLAREAGPPWPLPTDLEEPSVD